MTDVLLTIGSNENIISFNAGALFNILASLFLKLSLSMNLSSNNRRSSVQSSPFRVIFLSLTLLVRRFKPDRRMAGGFSANPEPLKITL